MNDNHEKEQLLTIIGLLSSAIYKETTLYLASINQIKRLISDAVDKINLHVLSDLNDEQSSAAFEKNHTNNLLVLLHRALDISKLINKKMDGVMRAAQIDDIASQIVDELSSNMQANQELLQYIESMLHRFNDMNSEERQDVLLVMQAKIIGILDKKDRNHVQQRDLNEGTMELF